mgnify:CR=1 FL=1
MIYDLVVNLYEDDFDDKSIKVKNDKITILRVLSPNADAVIRYIESTFTSGWASEAKAALYKNHPTCFIAVKGKEIVGFACYDATAKGYFGPTGVSEAYRGQNIGQRLLYESLKGLKQDGYGYAIIGGVSQAVYAFYARYFSVHKVESKQSIYKRLV